MFNETIAANIAYGAPDATREQIEEAARQANAYDFIKSFPEGFDTPVGERGAQLSGGKLSCFDFCCIAHVVGPKLKFSFDGQVKNSALRLRVPL